MQNRHDGNNEKPIQKDESPGRLSSPLLVFKKIHRRSPEILAGSSELDRWSLTLGYIGDFK